MTSRNDPTLSDLAVKYVFGSAQKSMFFPTWPAAPPSTAAVRLSLPGGAEHGNVAGLFRSTAAPVLTSPEKIYGSN